MSTIEKVSGKTMMIVTNTNRTLLWLFASFQGERQLVDITDKNWRIVSNNCAAWCNVVNTLKAEGHDVVDALEVE